MNDSPNPTAPNSSTGQKLWNKKAEYEAEIAPIAEQLFNACNRLGLPLIVLVQTSNNSDGYGTCAAVHIDSTILVPAEPIAAIASAIDDNEITELGIAYAAMKFFE